MTLVRIDDSRTPSPSLLIFTLFSPPTRLISFIYWPLSKSFSRMSWSNRTRPPYSPIYLIRSIKILIRRVYESNGGSSVDIVITNIYNDLSTFHLSDTTHEYLLFITSFLPLFQYVLFSMLISILVLFNDSDQIGRVDGLVRHGQTILQLCLLPLYIIQGQCWIYSKETM